MPYLHRPGGSVFYDDTGGSGCPVITSHGFIENGSYWSLTGVTDALVKAGYRVINADLRGHGRSVPSATNPDYGEEHVVGDFSAVADALGFDKFHLLTHATGGIAGSRFAMAHHDRLRSFIATNTGSATLPVLEYTKLEWDDKEIPALEDADPEMLKSVRPTFLNDTLRSGVSFNKIVADLRADRKNHILGAFFNRFDDNQDPDRCWRIAEQLYATNNPQICADFADDFFQDPDPQVKRLRQIGCPALVLVGEYDRIMVQFSNQLARNIPGAEYVVLDGVGHMTAIEDPERTIGAIVDFLGRH